MLTVFTARVDRRIANAIIARARRRWPLLWLVPDSVIRPLVMPSARTIRRELAHTALTRVAPAGALVGLVLLRYRRRVGQT